MNVNDFEKNVSFFNENYFLKEFTYSGNKFKDSSNQEQQAADCVINFNDTVIFIETKERNLENSYNHSSTEELQENERKWFKNKILKEAKKQIKKDIDFFENHIIFLKNHRGHEIEISIENKIIFKIILYDASENLPDDCSKIKFYQSKTHGIIHIFNYKCHQNLVNTLITPSEIIEYLQFRESLINRSKKDMEFHNEKEIIGQYISGNYEDNPSEKYLIYFDNIMNEKNKWDMSWLYKIFEEKLIYTSLTENDYYFILIEIAKLKRHELHIFKYRFFSTLATAKKNQAINPYRFSVPTNNSGFIFIPICKEVKNQIDCRELLEELTILHKYQQKLQKCVGVMAFFDEDGSYFVEWSYIDQKWEEDKNIDARVDSCKLLREVQFHDMPRYNCKIQ